jgi:acyl-CoA reductase-like NAD-dependent aldehyde dehydrogenase
MRKFISRNPYTGKVLKEFDFLTDSQLDAKIERAGSAFLKMIGKSQKQKPMSLSDLPM